MEAARAGLALLGAACLWLPLAAVHAGIGPTRPRHYRLARVAGPGGGGALAIAAALLVLWSGDTVHATLFTLWPGAPVEAAASPVGALFWLLLGMASLALGLSPPADASHAPAPGRATPVLTNLLLAALLGLTATGDARSFTALWEVAILLLCALTEIGAPHASARRVVALPVALAGSGICMLATLLLLDGGCRSVRFVELAACAPHLNATRGTMAFLTALAGSVLLAVAAPHLARRGTRGAAPLLLSLLTGQAALLGVLLVTSALLRPEGAWWALPVLASSTALCLYAARGLARCVAHTPRPAATRAAPALGADQARLPCLASIGASGATLAALGSLLLLRAPDARPLAPAAHWLPLLGATALCLCLVSGVLGSTLLALGPPVGAGRDGGMLLRLGALSIWTLSALGGLAGGWLTLYALVRAAGRLTTPVLGGVVILLAAVLGLTGFIGASALPRVRGPYVGAKGVRLDGTRAGGALAGLALLLLAPVILPGGAAWLLQTPMHDMAGLAPGSAHVDVVTVIGLPAFAYGPHDTRETFAPLVVLACVVVATLVAERAPRLLARRSTAQVASPAPPPLAVLFASGGRAPFRSGAAVWPAGNTARRLFHIPPVRVPPAATRVLSTLWARGNLRLPVLYVICLLALLLVLAL